MELKYTDSRKLESFFFPIPGIFYSKFKSEPFASRPIFIKNLFFKTHKILERNFNLKNTFPPYDPLPHNNQLSLFAEI